MKKLSSHEILQLARSKTYEEFLINKDLIGWHNKKFCQKHAVEILTTMAAQQHDNKLACKIINEAKHIMIGDDLKYRMFDAWYTFSGQTYIKNNLLDMWHAVRNWFAQS